MILTWRLLLSILTTLAVCQKVPDVSRMVSVKKQILYDDLGRYFGYGTNGVAKTAPFIPDIRPDAPPKHSFNQRDIDVLSQHGVTVIRLGIMWPGVEPVRGQYNQTYLDGMKKIVQMCSDAGIYVLLDFHQDLLSEKYSGEGVPQWIENPNTGALGFPSPISPPYKLNPCLKLPWGYCHFPKETQRGFQGLYSNVNGKRDAFVECWKVVAKAFLGFKNILGYDIKNEPFNGDAIANVLLSDVEYVNENNFLPFYEAVSEGIRGIDPNAIIHFESATIIQEKAGFSTVPGGPQYDNKTVFNFHCYETVQSNPLETVIGYRIQTAEELQCGTFLGEYEMGVRTGAAAIQKHSVSANKFLLSMAGWEYKEYIIKGQMITGTNDGLVDEEGKFQDESKVFILKFNFNGCTDGYEVLIVSTSGSFAAMDGNGVSKNSIYVAPDSGKAANVGSGVAVAVYPQGSNLPALTAPDALTAAPTPAPLETKKAGKGHSASVSLFAMLLVAMAYFACQIK
ncbi:glycoside hydrolase superfamily [Chytriomyces cf. hyalinus JEL632]|nr:glycoside hydrolase superfamily [Chytriomyces cf. hyalinus JEL632]